MLSDPITNGCEGSPSANATSTSLPTRGTHASPVRPAGTATRIHALAFSSAGPTRSKRNWTLIRPCSSRKTSCPAGPATTPETTPPTRGTGVVRGGRNVVPEGIAEKSLA